MVPYHEIPHWAIVDLEEMAIKESSAFHKAPALLVTQHQIVYQLPLGREVRLPQRVSWNDAKQSDGEAILMVEL